MIHKIIIDSYIYPALHGSYGFTYSPNSQSAAESARAYLQVDTANSGTLHYILHSSRYDSAYMNKFHVNIPASANAVGAFIIVEGQMVAHRILEKAQDNLNYTVNGAPLD